LGKYIYVAGGCDGQDYSLYSGEKFDLLKNKWSPTKSLPDGYSFGITLISIKNRFIYGFGGGNEQFNALKKGVERIMRLDTHKQKDWECIQKKNPAKNHGWNYGVYPVSFHSTNTVDFLLFGSHYTKKSTSMCLVRTCLSDISATTIER